MHHQPDPAFYQAALAARPDDDLLRWHVRSVWVADALIEGDCVAVLERSSTQAHVIARGEDPDVVAAVLRALIARHPDVAGVSVPQALRAGLPHDLRPRDPANWCMWVLPPDEFAAREASYADLARSTVELDRADERIDELLAHSSSAHLFSDSTRVTRWIGVVEREELLAVAAQARMDSGTAYIASVCTAPDARGRGLGGAPCARIVSDAYASGAPMASLEMYSDNIAGRRLYERLGFREVAACSSGPIPGVPSLA